MGDWGIGLIPQASISIKPMAAALLCYSLHGKAPSLPSLHDPKWNIPNFFEGTAHAVEIVTGSYFLCYLNTICPRKSSVITMNLPDIKLKKSLNTYLGCSKILFQ